MMVGLNVDRVIQALTILECQSIDGQGTVRKVFD